MIDILPRHVREGLEAAQTRDFRRKNRLRVSAGDLTLPVLRYWETGFAMADTAPRLRGLVELYDGAKLLAQCLIVATEDEAGERRYEFKRRTAPGDGPALDYWKDENAPAALLPRA